MRVPDSCNRDDEDDNDDDDKVSSSATFAMPACHFAMETGLCVAELLGETVTGDDSDADRDATTATATTCDASTAAVSNQSAPSMRCDATLPVLLLAWTTAPWSLLLNEAVVVSAQASYALLKVPREMLSSCCCHGANSSANDTESDDVEKEEACLSSRPHDQCILVSSTSLANAKANASTTPSHGVSQSSLLPALLAACPVLHRLSGTQLLARVQSVRHPINSTRLVPLRGSALVHPGIGTGTMGLLFV
jgi:hypothetical protein